MGCLTFFKTTGVAVSATAITVLPYEIHRKGLFLSAVGGDIQVAVGQAPATADYFTIKDGTHIKFDDLVPLGAVWAKGTGTLVYAQHM